MENDAEFYIKSKLSELSNSSEYNQGYIDCLYDVLRELNHHEEQCDNIMGI